MLDVDNSTVFNYILDKVRAESVLLFEEDIDARNVMYPKVIFNKSSLISNDRLNFWDLDL